MVRSLSRVLISALVPAIFVSLVTHYKETQHEYVNSMVSGQKKLLFVFVSGCACICIHLCYACTQYACKSVTMPI